MRHHGIRLDSQDNEVANRTKAAMDKKELTKGIFVKSEMEIFTERAKFLRDVKRGKS